MKRSEVLDKAKEIVCENRNKKYGEPEDSFARIAIFWNDYLNAINNRKLNHGDVAIMMILLKIARETESHNSDSFVDIAGYSACAEELRDISDKWNYASFHEKIVSNSSRYD